MPRTWTRKQRILWQIAAALVLVVTGALVTREIWQETWRLAVSDPGSRYLLLAPLSFLWLGWIRRSRIRQWEPRHRPAGCLGVALGLALIVLGERLWLPTLWHIGGVLVVVGCVVSAMGTRLLRLFLPAFAALVFLIPLPRWLWHEAAERLGGLMARLTEGILLHAGVVAERSGNIVVLDHGASVIEHGHVELQVAMMLLLLSFTLAFGAPLRNRVRVLLIVLSPACALAGYLWIGLTTVGFFSSHPAALAELFGEINATLVVPLALLLMLGVLATLRWAMVPLVDYSLARDE